MSQLIGKPLNIYCHCTYIILRHVWTNIVNSREWKASEYKYGQDFRKGFGTVIYDKNVDE